MRKKFTNQEKLHFVSEYRKGISTNEICCKNNIPRSTFYSWIKRYKISLDYNNKSLHKQKIMFKRIEDKLAILEKVNCTSNSPLKIKLYELEKLYGQYSVTILCETLKVDRGTFYNHIFRGKKDNTIANKRKSDLLELIENVFNEFGQIYGAAKISSVLRARSITASPRYVRKLMKELNLIPITISSKKDYHLFTTKKNDVLKLNFSASKPNEVWVSDTTSFKVKNKWLYLCVILDLFSRKVIAYKISAKHSTNLITATFKTAWNERNPQSLIFHSDREG